MVLPGGGRLDPLLLYERKKEKFPALAAVAERVLAMRPAAAASERVNSAAGANWTARRASLRVGRVGLMVYIYYNWRVLQRGQQSARAPSWEEWFEWLDTLPPLKRDAHGRLITPEEEAAAAKAQAAAAAKAQAAAEAGDVMEVA